MYEYSHISKISLISHNNVPREEGLGRVMRVNKIKHILPCALIQTEDD